jgi:signal peptidase I
MKKATVVILLILCVIFVSGCTNAYPKLPSISYEHLASYPEAEFFCSKTHPCACAPSSISQSMRPTIICNNTYVMVRPDDVDNMQIGDIIFFEHELHFEDTNISTVVHRIVGIGSDVDGKYYTTKGDNNFWTDDFKVRPYDIKYKIIGEYIG